MPDPQWVAECHVFQVYGDLRLCKRIGFIDEDRLHWQVHNAFKEHKNLQRILHKDFVSGWKKFQEVKFKKPDMKFALVFAITAMRQRLQREENKKEAARKKEIAQDEFQLDPRFKDMAMTLAKEKQSDDETRDAWWGGLNMVLRRKLWQEHKIKKGYSNETTVRAWAWKKHNR